jgi:hypothetical protein
MISLTCLRIFTAVRTSGWAAWVWVLLLSTSKESPFTDDYKSRPISDEAAITFNVVDLGTQKGKRKLVSSDGFNFTFKRQNKISTDWRCSVRNKTTINQITFHLIYYSFTKFIISCSIPNPSSRYIITYDTTFM